MFLYTLQVKHFPYYWFIGLLAATPFKFAHGACGFGMFRNIIIADGFCLPLTIQPTDPGSEDFQWKTESKDGMWALYYERRNAPRLYAYPVKSDDPIVSPPRDTLIKAVPVDPNTKNVYVFNFSWADGIKYNHSMPDGIDVYLRPHVRI